MKKTIIAWFISLMMIFSLNSCETAVYATTQDDIYVEATADIVHSTVDFNIIVRYGTPYYYNGSLLYYLYDGLYYYPFYYNNYWYIRAYRRPFDHLYYRPYFRPHRYDYRFERGYRPQHNWYRPTQQNRPQVDYRHPNNNQPNMRPNLPSIHPGTRVTPQTRPMQHNRGTITRPTTPSNRGGNFGGSRQGGRR